MALIVVEAVPVSSKPPAADDSMRTSPCGRHGFGALEPLFTRQSVTDVLLGSWRFSYTAEAGKARRTVISPGTRDISVLLILCSSPLRTLASVLI